MWMARTQTEKREGYGNGLVAVAIDKDKNSQNALKWAIDHILQRGSTVVLIHVKTKSSHGYSLSNSSMRSPPQNTNIYSDMKSLSQSCWVFGFRGEPNCRCQWRVSVGVQGSRSPHQGAIPSIPLLLYA